MSSLDYSHQFIHHTSKWLLFSHHKLFIMRKSRWKACNSSFQSLFFLVFTTYVTGAIGRGVIRGVTAFPLIFFFALSVLDWSYHAGLSPNLRRIFMRFWSSSPVNVFYMGDYVQGSILLCLSGHIRRKKALLVRQAIKPSLRNHRHSAPLNHFPFYLKANTCGPLVNLCASCCEARDLESLIPAACRPL